MAYDVSSSQHSTAQHSTAQHSTAQPSPTHSSVQVSSCPTYSYMHAPQLLIIRSTSTIDMCSADPKQYYEDVAPSSWKPEAPETWLELHRRAYCGHADAAFPILFIALVAIACSFQLLAPWLLLTALPVVFVVGLQCMVISGAPAARLLSHCLSRCMACLCMQPGEPCEGHDGLTSGDVR